MEYQGIITGIGDKEQNKNLIKPEYDAVLNDFIIGKNTILEGLVLNGKNISAGTCILCGYRGIIDMPKELDNTTYVYGKFTLNSIYGGSGEDDFDIVGTLTELTANVNPTEITSAGTYYLLLYENGIEQIDEERYPKNSQYSVETEKVLDNAVIAETATTPTELTKNELDEDVIATDLHLTQPNRVANTEYVHAQIEREIDYDTTTINIYSAGTSNVVGSIVLKRKAKYVIATYNYSYMPAPITIGAKFATLPDGYLPKNDFEFVMGGCHVKASTSGNITSLEVDEVWYGYNGETMVFGYECQ